MTRERFMDPGVCSSEQVARLKDFRAKLLWDRIITKSDDQGRRQGSAHSLKADCYPCDEISIEEIEVCRDALAEVGLLRLYEDDDGRLIMDIPPKNWARYQKLKYRRASHYPEFPGSGEFRRKPPDPASFRWNPPEPAGTCRNPAESVTGCGVDGCGGEGSRVDAVSSAARKGAAEENGEESAFAAEPVPAPALPAPDGPEGGAGRIRDICPETEAWIKLFERETTGWPGDTDGTSTHEAQRRIGFGFSAARLVLGHVWDINRAKTKRPRPTFARRMTLSRVPSDAALNAAAALLRAPVDHEGPGPPAELAAAFSLDAQEKRKKEK